MQRNKNIGLGLARLLDAIAQRYESIALACQNRAVSRGAVNQVFHFLGHRKRNVFFTRAFLADSAGVTAAMTGIERDHELLLALLALLLTGLDRRRAEPGGMQIDHQPMTGFAVGLELEAARADLALQIEHHAQAAVILARRTDAVHQVGTGIADIDRLAFARIVQVYDHAIRIRQGKQTMFEVAGEIENDPRVVFRRLRDTNSGESCYRLSQRGPGARQ